MSNEVRKHINSVNDFLFEMANYGTNVTGLPMMIWVGPKGKASHAPRIKVQRNHKQTMDSGNLFSVSISDKPRVGAGTQGDISNDELIRLFNWIRINREVLLRLWNNGYRDFDELKNDLIVMGAHGWKGVSKAIMGSTTERVIMNASCPVLVVKG